MDGLCWGKRWHNKSWKMAELNSGSWFFPIIILGQGKRVCWLVGGNVSKGSCPRSTFINDIQSQSHQNINLGQYRQPFYQPKPSQTPLTEFQKIQNFHFFWNRSSDCDPPRLNCQHQPRPKSTKIVRLYMDMLVWAKRWHNKMSKMKMLKCRAGFLPIIILGYGKRVCWLFGGKCVNRKLSQINFDQH